MTAKTASQPRTPDGTRRAAAAARPKLAFAKDDARGTIMEPARPARILIVEDDFLVAADVEAALLDAGFNVVGIAESADRAVEFAAVQKPALILMDIRLAGDSDGIDAAVEIYREHGIRSLFASAHSDAVARARAEPARPLGWLPKPYSMGRMLDAVRSALSEGSAAG